MLGARGWCCLWLGGVVSEGLGLLGRRNAGLTTIVAVSRPHLQAVHVPGLDELAHQVNALSHDAYYQEAGGSKARIKLGRPSVLHAPATRHMRQVNLIIIIFIITLAHAHAHTHCPVPAHMCLTVRVDGMHAPALCGRCPCIHTFIHTYNHAYIHTFIHTCTHTHGGRIYVYIEYISI